LVFSKGRFMINPSSTFLFKSTLASALLLSLLSAPKAQSPDAGSSAARQRTLEMKDENGHYDPNDLLKARNYVQTMPLIPGVWSPSGATGPTDGSDPDAITAAWEDIGPGNIGGRVRSLLIDPANPSNLFAGAVAGGIWRSTNGGALWSPVNDFLPNLAVTCMALDRLNPSVMYAGTGEFFTTANDGTQGAGVFQSTDGGATWKQLSSTATTEWQFVNGLDVSPANSQIVLAAQTNGLYRSTNAGATWTNVNPDFAQGVKFDPNNGNLAIAGGFDGLAWFSTDAGATWTQASGLPLVGRVELAYAKSQSQIVYAAVDNGQGELYRSTDGGHAFQKVVINQNPLPSLLSSFGFSDDAIWVDPTNPSALIVGGLKLWRSTDAGAHFTEIGSGTGIHEGHHVIVEAQDFATSHSVYFANDGGVFRANDYREIGTTQSFSNLNSDLRITLFYGGAGNVAKGIIAGGSQDNGLPRYNGTRNGWLNAAQLPDCGYVAALPGAAADGSTTFFGSYSSSEANVTGQSHFRLKFANDATPFAPELITNIPLSEDFLPIAPFILDPNNANGTLLKGSHKLWRYQNAVGTVSGTWEMIKPDGGGPISAIAVAPGNSGLIWVGDINGNVWSTANGSAAAPTWTLRNGTTLPHRFCTRLAIDPSNTSRVYATFGGFSPDNVYMTQDGGGSWANVTSNLPAIPVHSLVVDPANGNSIYVGTELGVFGSDNRGGAWSPSNGGPANVPVEELFWMDRKLVAVTHGRGMFRVTINSPLPTVALTSPANNAAFTGGANITLNASASSAAGIARVEFFSGSKKLGEDVLSPYSFVWKSVPLGAYALTARAVDVNGGAATSAVVNITVTGGTISPRNPTADAYVRDGNSAATNFGTATAVQVKNALAGQTGNNRDAYFKFSLTSITGYVSKARLRVFGNLSAAESPATAGAFSVASTSWIESGTNSITFNNKPPMAATPLATATMTGPTPAWHEFDVTDYVRGQRAQGKTALSLGLHGITTNNSFFSAASREAASNKPELSLSLVTPQALFVVGNATLVPGDLAVSNRLKALGFTVVVKAAAASVTADATGKALVLISSTVGSADVNTKFRAVAVPVLNWEEAIQDDMGMTGPTTGGDRGATPTVSQIVIANASHPLAAGLSGTVTVTTSNATLSWGVPSSAAVHLATISGQPFFGEYAYEKDAMMVGLTAPARRVHIFFTDATATILTTQGWSLFDAAVLWASGL
jgi:hypothetical protein